MDWSEAVHLFAVAAVVVVVVTDLETFRIGESKWILEYVSVAVDSAFQTNWIALRIASCRRVVSIPEVVVVYFSLRVVDS